MKVVYGQFSLTLKCLTYCAWSINYQMMANFPALHVMILHRSQITALYHAASSMLACQI